MVATLLGLPSPPTPDHAADAFAVAICHAGGAGARYAEHFGREPAATSRPVAREQLAG
jgi:microcystin degradation protein MlrC